MLKIKMNNLQKVCIFQYITSKNFKSPLLKKWKVHAIHARGSFSEKGPLLKKSDIGHMIIKVKNKDHSQIPVVLLTGQALSLPGGLKLTGSSHIGDL